ncbi:BCAS3 microtubule associated cell migration factor-like isoform X2 [Tubulanus polymorphus]|uniref:BCAS3 microtubule associated cell migration factor-like isoform X2 n=1 Tax=Tubulanus polymorphus TaxID=672921 RepID=UPI003DA40446
MSAESPRRGSRCGGAVVRPQAVSDKGVMESVVGFFQDVSTQVTQAYSGSQKQDDREKIQWISFEKINIPGIYLEPPIVPDLLLILGYTNGAQIWAITESGESYEVISVRQGPVKVLKILPQPYLKYDYELDDFSSKRPLMAMVDASSPGQPYCSVKFMSLKTGEEAHAISFTSPICGVECNTRVVIILFKEKIAAFDAHQLKQKFCITTCYPAPGPNPNPVALSTRWLAYADKKLVNVHQSCGGMTGDGAQSYAATVISAAKTITKGLTMFGETVVNSVTGKQGHTSNKKDSASTTETGYIPGIVTVIDCENVKVHEDSEGEGLIAHFPAHANETVAAMEFDPSGSLLLTACRLGHNFHVFKIMAHPWNCSLGAVHHIYTLHRGDTTAKVQNISFNKDSRWVGVSTLRGTTHVFPITPYGGSINVRTHTSNRVVNRASRFMKSAGLDDLDSRPPGRSSPVSLSSSPGSSGGHFQEATTSSIQHRNLINNNMNNPRLPPYPHPTTVYPLVQIRQGLLISSLTGSVSSSGKTKSPGQGMSSSESLCTATVFAESRSWMSSPNIAREREKKSVESLFVMSHTGNLVEYVLDPHLKSGIDKATDDSPIEVTATAKAQWNLIRSINSPEMRPPLSTTNPLIIPYDSTMYDSSAVDGQYGSHDSLSSNSSSKSENDEQWLSQVEIVTHVGPHRRLWMGPQFSFKTFQNTQNTTVLSSNSSALLSQSPETGCISTTDILTEDVDLLSLGIQPARSSPVAMPGAKGVHRHSVSSASDTSSPTPSLGYTRNPLYIEAGSFEHSPQLVEVYGSWPESQPTASGEAGDDQIQESIADAMQETILNKESNSGNMHIFQGR